MGMAKKNDKLYDIFAKAFHEVVLPLIEDIQEKMATKDDIDRIERRIIKIDDHLERHDRTLANHGKRITKLEL